MSRTNQSRITCTLDGVPLGVWENKDGGDTDSQETKYRLGGMGPEISLGGNQTVDNVTVQRLFDTEMQSRAKWILGRVGKGVLVVADQPLSLDGVPTGDPFVWTCSLKRCALPARSADGDDAAQIELEGTPSGPVA